MKYFSLSYRLTAADYKEYDRLYNKDFVKFRFRRLLPLYIVPVIICAFFDVQTTIIVGGIALFSFFLPIIGYREFSRLRADSSLFSRESTVEFYDNHIVTRLLPDGNFKGETEKHYGFEKVNRILESNDYFYFIFKENALLVIPKRYIGQEEYTMIKNLIENIFRNKYLFIQS